MLNIEQFAYLAIMRRAILFATPGTAGPNFTWKNSFPGIGLRYVQTEWWMADRSDKVFEKNEEKIKRIAQEIAAEFAAITGRE